MMRRLRALLGISAIAGAVLLVLAISWGIWVTATAAAGLLVGSIAGLRGRTWGIVLVLASGAAIAVVPFLGIAPWWFLGIGGAGLAPVIASSGALLRADRAAAGLVLSVALLAGVAGAESARRGWAFEAADAIEGAIVGAFAIESPEVPRKSADAWKGIPPGWCSGAEPAVPF
jgi:hypothetical protein